MVKIFENDNFIIDYDKDNRRYRVSVFDNGHFLDECWFRSYQYSMTEFIYEYASAFIDGAVSFMKYMQDHSDGITMINLSNMENILKEFLEQFGVIKETND